MLVLKFVAQKETLAPIYHSLSLGGEVSGANFVLYEDESAIGICRMHIDGDVACVDKFVFLPTVESGDKEFFFRAICFKLMCAAPMTLRIVGSHPELQSFGFQLVDGNTQVVTSDINLHANCGGRKE